MPDRVWVLLGEPGDSNPQPADRAWATVHSTRARAEAHFAREYYPQGDGEPIWQQPENPDMAEIEFVNEAGYDERYLLYLATVDGDDA